MTKKATAVAAAHYHPGSTTEYVISAMRRLGHEVVLLSADELYRSIPLKEYRHYFCVDSGEPLNLASIPEDASLEQVSLWLIDFRHNKDRATRHPNDWETASILTQRGGTLFQAQKEDCEACSDLERVHWLPLAADPTVWSAELKVEKRFHLGFVGNVWDQGRAEVLEILLKTPGLRFAFAGNGRAWKEDAAKLLRSCIAGFNVNSWFGQGYDYDVNMRVFETLSCGIPLITNEVPHLLSLFPAGCPYIRTYKSTSDLLQTCAEALSDASFLASGTEAADFIQRHCTYEHRIKKAFELLEID